MSSTCCTGTKRVTAHFSLEQGLQLLADCWLLGPAEVRTRFPTIPAPHTLSSLWRASCLCSSAGQPPTVPGGGSGGPQIRM